MNVVGDEAVLAQLGLEQIDTYYLSTDIGDTHRNEI